LKQAEIEAGRDYSGNEAEIEVGSDWIKVEAEIEAEIEACRD
jgi:hypothetical protein